MVAATRRSGILAGGAPSIRNATDVAVDLIRSAILEGRIGPGERLKEEMIARDLGLSRTPVREALLRLQGEGLVETNRNRGAAVRAYDTAEIEEMYQLRALLEGYAARRAAALIEPGELELLRESCERFAQSSAAGTVGDLMQENLVFHSIIVGAAGSARLAEFIRTVVELPLVYKSFYWYSPEQRKMSERHHLQLLRALEAHDEERSELIMKEHVFEARDFLIGQLKDAAREGGDALVGS